MINRLQVEEIAVEAENLKSLAHVLDIALSEGHTTNDCVAGAMYLLAHLMSDHARKLDELWRVE